MKDPLSRREFLKLSAISAGALTLRPWKNFLYQADFPDAERLGRVTEGAIRVRQRPDVNSPEIGTLYQDAVVPWLREVVGSNPSRYNQRWVETPEGYIWCPLLHPVRNNPNDPVESLPQSSLGEGMWVEVTVPYVDLLL
ncbi:MAG: twin-arginine translocation signal domain-containing protein, partial [Chloroflexota bacterium]